MIIQAYRTRVAPGDPGVLGVVIDAPPMNLIGPELVREGFAERARQELIANGETVRKRTVEIDTRLTPQEAEPVTLERQFRAWRDASSAAAWGPGRPSQSD